MYIGRTLLTIGGQYWASIVFTDNSRIIFSYCIETSGSVISSFDVKQSNSTYKYSTQISQTVTHVDESNTTVQNGITIRIYY